MKDERTKQIIKVIKREISKIDDSDISGGDFNSYITNYKDIEIQVEITFRKIKGKKK